MTQFEATIKAYLDNMSKRDSLFAKVYSAPGKTIEKCCMYIIQEVQKMRKTAMTDEEVYGMAVHYYDEESLQPVEGVAPQCRVVVPAGVKVAKKSFTKKQIEKFEKRQLELF